MYLGNAVEITPTHTQVMHMTTKQQLDTLTAQIAALTTAMHALTTQTVAPKAPAKVAKPKAHKTPEQIAVAAKIVASIEQGREAVSQPKVQAALKALAGKGAIKSAANNPLFQINKHGLRALAMAGDDAGSIELARRVHNNSVK